MSAKFETKLFKELTELVTNNEAFYSTDFVLDDITYRIFNYRLASYTDFLLPSALECRGHMFNVTNINNPVLVSLPMSKFFNLNENPMTMNLDLSTIDSVEVKADGSLISTYLHHIAIGRVALRLKSKGSLSSDQAIAAMEWLNRSENANFKDWLEHAALLSFTVNMEWVAPENRIVLGYEKPGLIVLNVRSNITGEYLSVEHMGPDDSPIRANYKSYTKYDMVGDPVQFIESVAAMTGIEGFIVKLKDGTTFKLKCDWYRALHHTKDSINNPRRLFEAILDEAIDDLRSMFFDDKLAIQQIDEMQIKVDHIYNHMVKTVEQFYVENKDLDRKSYAIKGQADLEQLYFSLAMNLYIGRTNDYKQFCKDKWKCFGLRDTALDD